MAAGDESSPSLFSGLPSISDLAAPVYDLVSGPPASSSGGTPSFPSSTSSKLAKVRSVNAPLTYNVNSTIPRLVSANVRAPHEATGAEALKRRAQASLRMAVRRAERTHATPQRAIDPLAAAVAQHSAAAEGTEPLVTAQKLLKMLRAKVEADAALRDAIAEAVRRKATTPLDEAIRVHSPAAQVSWSNLNRSIIWSAI